MDSWQLTTGNGGVISFKTQRMKAFYSRSFLSDRKESPNLSITQYFERHEGCENSQKNTNYMVWI